MECVSHLRRLLLALLALLVPGSASCDTKVFFLSGYDTYRWFAEIGARANAVAGHHGWEMFFSEGAGLWPFVQADHHYRARNYSDVEQAFAVLGKKLRAGDMLLLYVGDHGLEPSSFQKPLSAGIALGDFAKGTRDSWMRISDLQDLLLKYVPETVQVRLFGAQCYSGALHEISFGHPNVCSGASTDFRTVGYGNSSSDFYGMSLWHAFQSATPTLMQAHLESFGSEYDNFGRSQTSSMAYVDRFLSQGAYDPRNAKGFLFRTFLGKFIESFNVPETRPALASTLSLLDRPRFAAEIDRRFEHLGKLLTNTLPEIPQLSRAPFQWALEKWKRDRQFLAGAVDRFRADYARTGNPVNLRLDEILKIEEMLDYTQRLITFHQRAGDEQVAVFERLTDCENNSF